MIIAVFLLLNQEKFETIRTGIFSFGYADDIKLVLIIQNTLDKKKKKP